MWSRFPIDVDTSYWTNYGPNKIPFSPRCTAANRRQTLTLPDSILLLERATARAAPFDNQYILDWLSLNWEPTQCRYNVLCVRFSAKNILDWLGLNWELTQCRCNVLCVCQYIYNVLCVCDYIYIYMDIYMYMCLPRAWDFHQVEL